MSEALLAKGYRQVRKDVWVRLECKEDVCHGSAVWRNGDATFVGGAKFPLEEARALVEHLCEVIGTSPEVERKEKARRVLAELLASDLEHGTVGALDIDEDIETVAGAYSVGRNARRMARRARRLERRGARRQRRSARRERRRLRSGFRGSLNRLAKRVAHNKVLGKLREGYAKVITGPVGKVTSGAIAAVLQAYGVPPQATRLAIEAHHHRKAARLREGGWAGMVERSTAPGGSLRDEARREGRRWKEGYKHGLRQIDPRDALKEAGKRVRDARAAKGKKVAATPPLNFLNKVGESYRLGALH